MEFDLEQGMAVLERTPRVLREQLTGLDAAWLDGREGEGTWSPREVIAMLNELFDYQLPPIEAHGGEALKFMGEQALAWPLQYTFALQDPTIKVLALSFLLLIGMSLIGEGLDMHVPKGYIYAAMAFSALVEALNMMARSAQRKRRPLRKRPR